MADFSYESDALAQLIVEIWLGQYGQLLAAPTATDYAARVANAKLVLASKGVYLEKPIVITETEYEDGFSLADAGLTVTDSTTGTTKSVGVVLVVPDKDRATITMPSLLETAKMLMAVTPNGI